MKENNFKNKLLELIKNNPDLDLVCMCGMDEVYDEYSYMYFSNLSCSVNYIYEYDDRVFLDKEEIVEFLCNMHDGDAEYLELEDDDFEMQMHTEADKYFKQKAIVIYAKSC